MRVVARLYVEQAAEVEVEVPDGAALREVEQAALAALDDSGGAEWVTTYAESEWWPADGPPPRRKVGTF